MSEEKVEATNENGALKLNGLYAFKVGMSTVYNENGEAVPVTVLKYEPWIVSQLKTKDNDGYEAVQIACRPSKIRRMTKAEAGHLSKAGFERGAMFVREIRQAIPEGAQVGQKVDLLTFQKGDSIKISGVSRGRGFSGVVRRWNFNGGPATHGSGFHRRAGSVGNRTWPGRVMPGKRMAGHYGAETVSLRNVKIVDVLPEEGVVMVKGAVPGHRNSLVRLMKA